MLKFFSKRRGEKGFTLIELLVVIAIIGILATIVLVSLNTARKKARDVRRVSDLRQMALALEMYYDTAGGYVADGTDDDNDWDSLAAQLAPTYIGSIPTDPTNTGSYTYKYYPDGTTVNGAIDYVLGATLEVSGTDALSTDVDGTVIGLSCVDPVYCIRP